MLHVLETKLTKWWLPFFFLLLICIAIFKGGFGFEVTSQESEPAFPLPQPGLSALSMGLPALVWLLGIQGQATLIGVACTILTFIALAIFSVRVTRLLPRSTSRAIIIVVLLSPITLVLFNNLGRHDFLVISGALLFSVSLNSRYLAPLGILLMILGNPEQTVFATFALLILSLSYSFSFLRRIAIIAFAFSTLSFIALASWAHILGVESRVGWFGFHFKISLLNFFGNLPLSVYAAYGVSWILVIWLLSKSRGRDTLIISTALIAIPLFITMVTADQTRVFVGVSTLVFMVALICSTEEFLGELKRITQTPLAWIFIVGIAAPTIEITYTGAPRIPYLWIYDWAAGGGLLTPIGVGPW